MAGITGTVPPKCPIAEVAAIEAKLDNGVSGLVAIIAAIAAIPAGGDALEVTSQLIKTQTDKLGDAIIGLANLKTLIDAILVDTATTLENKLDVIDGIVDNILLDTSTTLEGKLDAIGLFLAALPVFPVDPADESLIEAAITAAHGITDALVNAIEAKLDNGVSGLVAIIAAIAAIPAGGDALEATSQLIKTQTDKLGDATIGLAAIKAYVDLIDDATNGLAAIKAEVEGLGGAAMRGTDGAALAVSWTAALATALGSYTAAKAAFLDVAISSRAAAATALSTATWTAARAGYLDNINQAGLLQVTAARAALLDQITAVRLAELNAANIPADIDTIKAALGVPAIAQATGTFVYNEANAAEQTMVTLAIAARSIIGGIWIDMVNVTQATTIRTYHRIDGANYRLFETDAWVVADEDGVLITGFTAYRNVYISLQCTGAGLGNVNVPYSIV